MKEIISFEEVWYDGTTWNEFERLVPFDELISIRRCSVDTSHFSVELNNGKSFLAKGFHTIT